MGNVIDYCYWRGDLNYKQIPFNAVDAVVLCQLSYLNFTGIVDSHCNNPIPLRDVSEKFYHSPDFETRGFQGTTQDKRTTPFLGQAADTERFGNLKVCGYTDQMNYDTEEQFCAMTFLSDDWACIVFRGTDDSLLGWKEDMNMAYKDEIPSQIDAIRYVEAVADNIKGPLYIAGHSKGGNLAVYSAANVDRRIKKRIINVFNNDGPGFKKEFLESKTYLEIRDKIKNYIPELSIVGMLFEHDDNYITIKSEGNGIQQHDLLFWQVKGGSFIELNDRNSQSKFISKTVNEWYNSITKEEREKFIEAAFEVLNAPELKTNSEIADNLGKAGIQFMKKLASFDSKSRNDMIKILMLLAKYAYQNYHVMIKHK